MQNLPIVIVGGGLSGLYAAFLRHKCGIVLLSLNVCNS